MGWPSRPVLFSDIVADVLDVLEALGHPTYMTVPKVRPATFITAQLVGGQPGSDISETARINIECWSNTHGDAHDLAQLAARQTMTMIGVRDDGSIIKKVELTAKPAFMPDIESEQPRFRFTINVHRTAKDYR